MEAQAKKARRDKFLQKIAEKEKLQQTDKESGYEANLPYILQKENKETTPTMPLASKIESKNSEEGELVQRKANTEQPKKEETTKKEEKVKEEKKEEATKDTQQTPNNNTSQANKSTNPINIKEINEKKKYYTEVLVKRENLVRTMFAMAFGVYLFIIEVNSSSFVDSLKLFAIGHVSVYLQFIMLDVIFIAIYKTYLNSKQNEINVLLKATMDPSEKKDSNAFGSLFGFLSKALNAFVI